MLERFFFSWKRIDGEDFSLRRGEYRSAMLKASGEDFDDDGAENLRQVGIWKKRQ